MDFVSYIPAIILLILGFGLVVLEMYLPGLARRASSAAYCWWPAWSPPGRRLCRR